MAQHDTHTRLVGWLKVALPLAALAILSTLFLISDTIDPTDAIKYSDVDVADRVREPRMTDPSYAGVTSDGASLTITANEARPDGDDGASALGLLADLQTPDGAKTTFSAGRLLMKTDDARIEIGGGVTITSSAGFSVQTEALTLSLAETGAESMGPITATGPLGEMRAGKMVLSENPDAPGQYVLVFKNRVSLIYQPH